MNEYQNVFAAVAIVLPAIVPVLGCVWAVCVGRLSKQKERDEESAAGRDEILCVKKTKDKSWLESCWEEDLEANKDNPNPYVQCVAESFRRVLRLGKLTDRAHEVFGDPKRAAEWLTSPQFALGGKTPFEYADTEPGGVQVVEDLLGQLEHAYLALDAGHWRRQVFGEGSLQRKLIWIHP